MKDVKVTLNTKGSVIIGGVVLLVLAVAVLFSYKEMSSMRRDLYGVRADYYGLNSQETGYVDDGTGDKGNWTANFEIVSQKVASLRINDDDATNAQTDTENWEQKYKTAQIRVVEVKITNDMESPFYYSGNLGYVDDNGVVKRSIVLHPDDDSNTLTKNYASLELAPGGTATVYLYFLDTGKEITELYNSDSGM